MNNKLIFIISTIVFLFSCRHSESTLTFKANNFEIRMLPEGSPFSVVLDGLHNYSIKDTTFSTFFNNNNSSIYITSLNSPEKIHKIIKLNDSIINRDAYGDLNTFSISNQKVAFFQLHRFGLYNLETDSLEYERSIEGTEEFPIYFVDYDFPIEYDDDRKELFTQLVDYRDQDSKLYAYESQFSGLVKLPSQELTVLPITYPPIFNNGELGMSGFVRTYFEGDSILYSFSVTDSLVIYNTKNGKTDKVNAGSKYFKSPLLLSDSTMREVTINREHLNQNFLYEDILYDKWRKCYYRPYAKFQQQKNENGLFNTSSDKERGLIILDSNFKIIGEISLPNKIADTFGVSKAGFFYMTQDSIADHFKNYVNLDIKITP